MTTETDEVQLLKAALCMKEHELYAVRAELDRRSSEMHMLVLTIERLEKTISAAFDRMARKLERRRH